MGRRSSKTVIAVKKPSVKKVLQVVTTTKKKTRTRPRTTRLGLLGHIAGGFWGPHGADLGRAAGNMIAKITGMGDYKVNQNSISSGNAIPTFMSASDGMRVCHREFLMDVTGSTSFSLTNFFINPGIATSFPFLSNIARNFEEYDFHGLVFEYRPTSGTAISSSSSALGVVIMATNYDVADINFLTKQQMESYEFSNATVPFTACIHPVECARNRNVLESLYVRSSTPVSNTDQHFYDLGNFQIATAGMQSAYTVGELWVSYDVFLRKPRLNIFTDPSLPAAWHASSGPAASGSSASALLGTTPLIDGVSQTGFQLVTNGNTVQVLVREVGTYIVTYAATFAAGFSSGLSTSRGSNLALTNRLKGRASSSNGTVNAGTIINYDESFNVVSNTSTSSNYLTCSFIPASGNGDFDITISKLPGGIALAECVVDNETTPYATRRNSLASFTADFSRLEFDEEEKIDRR